MNILLNPTANPPPASGLDGIPAKGSGAEDFENIVNSFAQPSAGVEAGPIPEERSDNDDEGELDAVEDCLNAVQASVQECPDQHLSQGDVDSSAEEGPFGGGGDSDAILSDTHLSGTDQPTDSMDQPIRPAMMGDMGRMGEDDGASGKNLIAVPEMKTSPTGLAASGAEPALARSSESIEFQAKDEFSSEQGDIIQVEKFDPNGDARASVIFHKIADGPSGVNIPHIAQALRPQAANHIMRQLGEKLVSGKENVIEIVLSPDELGNVRMFITQGSSLSVTIQAERPDVADLLRRNTADLEDELARAGFSGADISFSDEGHGGESANQQRGPLQGYEQVEFESPIHDKSANPATLRIVF